MKKIERDIVEKRKTAIKRESICEKNREKETHISDLRLKKEEFSQEICRDS